VKAGKGVGYDPQVIHTRHGDLTPEQVADFIETWHREGAADGFNLMIDVLPSGLRDVVEQVVPLLQRRGVFHRDYPGTTLRENLGLKKPN